MEPRMLDALMEDVPEQIDTGRLILRRVRASDAPALNAYLFRIVRI